MSAPDWLQAHTEFINEMKWRNSVCDFFIEPDNVGQWSVCPECGTTPRIWVFDNGRHAKCWCSEPYGKSRVEAEPIMDVLNRTGGVVEYDRDELRAKWNTLCALSSRLEELE